MESLGTPLGIALFVIAGLLAIKAVKTVLKLVFLVVAAVGLYLWLGPGSLGI